MNNNTLKCATTLFILFLNIFNYISPVKLGEEVESPAEEEEELDPEELADIEEERREMEEEAFRATRWPAYVQYVDSLVCISV